MDIKNTEATDALEQVDTVRWYQFTLENTSDAVVRFSTEMEGREYFPYWHITVYRASNDQYVTGDGVGCGPVRYNDILLANLEPGTYYVRVMSRTKGSLGSPSDCYSDSPYTIQVITEGYRHPTGDAQRTKVTKAGEIIAVIGGNIYIKRNDGEAYVACCVTGSGSDTESGIVLLADNANAVEYYTPYITDMLWYIDKLSWNGTTYYYPSNIRDGYDGAGADPTLYQCRGGETISVEAAVNDLIRFHFGSCPEDLQKAEEQAEKEESDKVTAIVSIVIGAVVVLIVVVVIIGKIRESNAFSTTSSTGGYSSGGYSTSGSTTRMPTEQEWREVDDMRIIQQINRNINTPGYEADGPAVGPGPEDFPSSDSIW